MVLKQSKKNGTTSQRRLLIQQEFDVNQDRPGISQRTEELHEDLQFTNFERCGGGRRVIRKRVHD